MASTSISGYTYDLLPKFIQNAFNNNCSVNIDHYMTHREIIIVGKWRDGFRHEERYPIYSSDNPGFPSIVKEFVNNSVKRRGRFYGGAM